MKRSTYWSRRFAEKHGLDVDEIDDRLDYDENKALLSRFLSPGDYSEFMLQNTTAEEIRSHQPVIFYRFSLARYVKALQLEEKHSNP